jgi:hypothetical protein
LQKLGKVETNFWLKVVKNYDYGFFERDEGDFCESRSVEIVNKIFEFLGVELKSRNLDNGVKLVEVAEGGKVKIDRKVLRFGKMVYAYEGYLERNVGRNILGLLPKLDVKTFERNLTYREALKQVVKDVYVEKVEITSLWMFGMYEYVDEFYALLIENYPNLREIKFLNSDMYSQLF